MPTIAPTSGIGLIANYMSLSALSLGELLEARSLVEPIIAHLAAQRITPEAARKLERLLAEISGNRLLTVIEEPLIRLFMDAEFALSIGDIGMSPEEIACNASVLQANRAHRCRRSILVGHLDVLEVPCEE